MAEPQLLVDQAQRLVNGGALLDCDLDVGKCEELQNLVLGAPDAAKLVLRPASGRRGDDLALGGSLARPAARLEILFEDLDRSPVVALLLDFFFAQVHVPGAAFLAPPRLAVPAAGPPTFVSSAAIRAFSASFSSRAAAAIALTASNSSRPTKSVPPIHSLNFSRALASASRPMPAKVPAKPFTIFTKSSNTLFSDCIEHSPFRRGNRDLARISPPSRPDLSPTGATIPRFLGAEEELDIAFRPGDRARRDPEHCPALRFHPCLRLGADTFVNGGITDDAALPHLLPRRLELRLDQRDQPGAGLRQFQRRFENLRQPDEARVAHDDLDRLRNNAGVHAPRIRLLMNHHSRVLAKLPCELVGADVDRIHSRRATAQQHVGEPTGRAAHVERHRARNVETEMRQPMIELDSTARNPWMVLAPNLEQPVLGKQLSRLRHLPLAREYRASHDQRLRPRPALRQSAAHQQLVCAHLAHVTRSSSRPIALHCPLLARKHQGLLRDMPDGKRQGMVD